jgi:hypothetical protein
MSAAGIGRYVAYFRRRLKWLFLGKAKLLVAFDALGLGE